MFKEGDYYIVNENAGNYLVRLHKRVGHGFVVDILYKPNSNGLFLDQSEAGMTRNASTFSHFYSPDIKADFFNLDYLPKSEHPESCLE
jgi:hypothetical protein